MMNRIQPPIVTPGAGVLDNPTKGDLSYRAWMPSTNPGIRMRPDSASRPRDPFQRPMSATARRAIEESEQSRLVGNRGNRPASSVGFREKDMEGDESGWLHCADGDFSSRLATAKRPATALGVRQGDRRSEFVPAGAGRPPRPPSADMLFSRSVSKEFDHGMDSSFDISRGLSTFANTRSSSLNHSHHQRPDRSEIPEPLMILLASQKKSIRPILRRQEHSNATLQGIGGRGRNRRQERWRNAQRDASEKRLKLSCIPPAAFLRCGTGEFGDQQDMEAMQEQIMKVCNLQRGKAENRERGRAENRERRPVFKETANASQSSQRFHKAASRIGTLVRMMAPSPQENATSGSKINSKRFSDSSVENSLRSQNGETRTIFQRKLDARVNAYRESEAMQEVLKDRVEWRRAEVREQQRASPYLRANMRSASRWREARTEENERAVRRREELQTAAQRRRTELERERQEKLGIVIQQPATAKIRGSSASCVRNEALGSGDAALRIAVMTDDFAEMNAKILSIYTAHQERDGNQDMGPKAEEHTSTCESAPGPEMLTAGGTVTDSNVLGGNIGEHHEVDEDGKERDETESRIKGEGHDGRALCSGTQDKDSQQVPSG